MALIDVSMPVTTTTAAFPGDVTFSCGWTGTKQQGNSVNIGWAKTSPHVGTHVDAPYHYDDAGVRVGGLALDTFVGPCVVIDALGASELDARLLRDVPLERTPRVLFRTQSRTDPTVFMREFPTLTPEACDALARAKVRLVGVDVPSFDAADSKELPIHHALGRAGIANVENLVLDDAAPGFYHLIAPPLRWVDMDAAPLRAILQR
ncbi:MAG TPA: cyclase family protein [Candidatus Thermoplasmatota archaeon]|nr:cyclase family protein [Candidatus Thermoplasmatota archaeon]